MLDQEPDIRSLPTPDIGSHGESEGAQTNGHATVHSIVRAPEPGQVIAVGDHRAGIVRRSLVIADALSLTLAYLLAAAVAGMVASEPTFAFVATLPLWIGLASLYGLYERDVKRVDHTTADDFASIFHLVTVGSVAFFGGTALFGMEHIEIGAIGLFWVTAIMLMAALRAGTRAWFRRRYSFRENVVIIGAGYVGQLVARKLRQHPEYGLTPVGFVDADPKDRWNDLEDLELLGELDDLPDLVSRYGAKRVIVAFSQDSMADILEVTRLVKDLDIQVDIVPRLFEILGPGVELHMVEGLPLVGVRPPSLSKTALAVKRAMDVVVSVAALTLLSPVLIFIALRIRFARKGGGPVLYRHERIGKGGRPFRLYKFRTMHKEFCRGPGFGGEEAEAKFRELMDDPKYRQQMETAYKLTDDPRVTPFGNFLRRWSLDELPQLLNVVKGDISLVGPRPITTDELGRYGTHTAALLNVRPGVTGYWQINGRSNVSYEERVRLDMAYVGSWSVKLDLTILAKTLRILTSNHGAV